MDQMTTLNNRTLYFLHIPKTAGGTLIYLLDNYFHHSEIFPALLMSDLLKVPHLVQAINDYRFIRGHFDYSVCHLLEPPFDVFTMLRDPVERSVSQYEHGRRHQDATYWDLNKLVSDTMPFADFLTTEEAKEFLGNIQTRSFVPEWYDISNFKWDTAHPVASEEMLLDLAKKRLEAALFVGLQERFADSLRLLLFKLHLPRPKQLISYNVAEKRSKVSELSREVQNQLRELNNLDIQLYEFGWDLFEERFAAMSSYLNEMFPGKSIDEQLDQYYDQHRVANQLSVTLPARFSFDQPLVGTNWYQREPFQDGYVRWTGPERIATLEYPLTADTDVKVEIASTGAITLDVLESFQFQVNDTVVPLDRTEGFPGIIFRGVIPASAFQASKSQTFKFLVDKTIRTSDIYPESEGNRKLGICIHSINFTEM